MNLFNLIEKKENELNQLRKPQQWEKRNQLKKEIKQLQNQLTNPNAKFNI